MKRLLSFQRMRIIRPSQKRGALQALLLTIFSVIVIGCGGKTGFFAPSADEHLQDSPANDDVVRIALILPLSSPRQSVAKIATSFRNAAEMAYQQDKSGSIELVILDDTGTVNGAALAADQALAQNVDAILGPLLAPSVQEVSRRARVKGTPVIAFSTDANLAGPGTFLFSFLPQSEVNRVIDYAAQNGRRSFAGLMPNSPYAHVVEGFFRQAVERAGKRVYDVERYPLSKKKSLPFVDEIAALAKGPNPSIDAIFLPDGGRTLKTVAERLQEQGVDFNKTLIMGTGLWASAKVQAIKPLQQGAIFAAPDGLGWRQFSQAYSERFGAEPARATTLAYDAIGLVLHLVNQHGSRAFDPEVITNPKGFSGIDGIFRFLRTGVNERALAIHKITPEGTEIIDPAPTSFISATN